MGHEPVNEIHLFNTYFRLYFDAIAIGKISARKYIRKKFHSRQWHRLPITYHELFIIIIYQSNDIVILNSAQTYSFT